MSNLESVKPTVSKNGFFHLDKVTPSLCRLAKYIEICREDIEKAIPRYRWNTAIGSGFYGPLQTLEIELRENINFILPNQFGENWCDNSCTVLQAWSRDELLTLHKKYKVTLLLNAKFCCNLVQEFATLPIFSSIF